MAHAGEIEERIARRIVIVADEELEVIAVAEHGVRTLPLGDQIQDLPRVVDVAPADLGVQPGPGFGAVGEQQDWQAQVVGGGQKSVEYGFGWHGGKKDDRHMVP